MSICKITSTVVRVYGRERLYYGSSQQSRCNIIYTRTYHQKQIRSYIGMCAYLKSYIPRFSEVAYPLTEMTKGRNPSKFQLNDEQRSAFQKLKELLSTPPVLMSPRYSEPFYIFSDSSDRHWLCARTDGQVQHHKTDSICF